MTSKVLVVAGVACLSTSWLRADFSYRETTRISGGAMAGMIGTMGRFSRSMREAREPIESTVLVKGNRMAHINARETRIIDLDKETFTEINFEKKTYSVVTFAQMAEAMAKMSQQMRSASQQQQQQQPPSPDAPQMNIKVDVKETGQKRVISGLDAREFILTVQMEAVDPKTGKSGTIDATSEIWTAASIPGYEEVRNFYKRMALKMAGSMNLMGGGAANFNPQFGAAATRLAQEGAKLEGIHILQVMRFGGPGTTLPAAEGAPSTGQQQPPPSAKDTAGDAAAGSALGRLGRLGGIGGLGGVRRKKEQAPPPAQTESQAPPAQAGSSGSLLETTAETTDFSSAPVDASKFEVPAGFKQEEHPMVKMANRK